MRRALFLLVLLGLPALFLWSWRPPIHFSGTEPVFNVAPDEITYARAMSDSLFMKFGAPVDTVEWNSNNVLRVRLQRGAFIQRTRYADEGRPCLHSVLPTPAVTNVAISAYRIFGRGHNARAVTIDVPSDSAAGGGWFHRGWCRGGGGSMTLQQSQLDSAIHASIPAV